MDCGLLQGTLNFPVLYLHLVDVFCIIALLDRMENGSYEVKYNGDIVLTGTGNFAYHGETKQMGCCSGNCQGQSSSSSSPLPSNGGDGEGDDDDLIVGDGDGDDSTPAPSPLVPAGMC